MVEDDAVLELQNAIQEAEGLYVQVEQLEKQLLDQDEKMQEQAKIIADLQAEISGHHVKTTKAQEQVELLRKKEEFASEGYQDSKRRLREQQHEIELLQKQVHDLEFQLLSMDAEQSIVLPRLTEAERTGLGLFKNVNKEEFHVGEDKHASFVSRLATLAAEHKQKVDSELEVITDALKAEIGSRKKLEAQNQSLNDRIQELLIEAGTAKLGRNQFLALARELKEELTSSAKESDGATEYYLKEMKFFSDQYASLKQTDANLREQVDLASIATKASELEETGESNWTGISGELAEFSELLKL